MKHRYITIAAAAAALALFGAACDQEDEADRTKHGRGDAPIGRIDDRKAEIINMPDDYNNLATKCDNHGHRVYSTTRHDEGQAFIQVIDDPTCAGGVEG